MTAEINSVIKLHASLDSAVNGSTGLDPNMAMYRLEQALVRSVRSLNPLLT